MKRYIASIVLAEAVLAVIFCPPATGADKEYHQHTMHHVVLAGKTSSAQPIISRELPEATASDKQAEAVRVDLEAIVHPCLTGIGGAFNEQGGDAFMSLPEPERKKLAEALFNPGKGAGFSLCRTAIGSSDFGLGAYSYSETPDDYEMKHFSVERDTKSVIPFILAAKTENPDLRIFASPWSPPGWMKESGKMASPGKANVLKKDPQIYAAYALYFTKYVQCYAAHGVKIDRIIIQNETDMNPAYPGCNMLPEQMAELIENHIRPQFDKDGVKTEIWAGTFRGQKGGRNDAAAFMKLKEGKAIDGLGLQYAMLEVIKGLRRDFPDTPLMHTEGDCFNGKNDVGQASRRFSEVADWLYSGTENYCYWNMVLNEKGSSAWGWRQNSLVKVNRKAGTVTYNHDFAPMALLSRFIRPGDQLLAVQTPGSIRAIAVKNNDQLVVFLQNSASEEARQTIELSSGARLEVRLPATSICAIEFK
jgi:glucosylceramidase